MKETMQERRVDRIDADLERLQPVAVDHTLECEGVAVRRDKAVEMRKRRRLARPEISKQDAALFHDRIRLLLDVGAEIAVVRFGRGFEALAVDIEQPAVKRATQAAVLETTVREISAAVRATTADQSVAATFVPEDDKVLAKQAHRFDGTIAGQFIDQCRRLPIASQQASRRRAGTGSGYEVVLLGAQHGRLSLFFAGRLYTKSVEDRKPWPAAKTKRPAQWPAANSPDGQISWGAWPSLCPCGAAMQSGAGREDVAPQSWPRRGSSPRTCVTRDRRHARPAAACGRAN